METNFSLKKEDILQELSAIAMAKATDFLCVRDGTLEVRETESMDPRQAAAIASIERSAGGLKVKFYDKLKALELLGKYMGLFDHCLTPEESDNDLLQTILSSTKEVIPLDDIPEAEQAAVAGDDLVEQTRS